MAQSLGSLYIELKANVEEFVSGMGKSSYVAKQLGRDLNEVFDRVGGLAGKLLAPFGEIGRAIGEGLGSIGSSANFAAKEFSGLGEAMGPLAISGGVAAAALLAVEGGAIAIAVHSAEATAKMYDLSQSTGIAIEALSGLSFVAKTVGIDQETLAKTLEKMDKAVAKAAASPDGAVNAFSRLNVQLKNTDGSVRPVEAIFGDLTNSFSSLKDGAEKTAAEIEIFGKGGAALAPLLNLPKEKVQELLETARVLGLVLDKEAGQAASAFREKLVTIGAAGEGVSIKLEKALLPALTVVADSLVSALKDSGSTINEFISFIAEAIKDTILFGDLVLGVFRELYDTIKFVLTEALALIVGVAKAAYAAVHFDWTGIKKAATDAVSDMEAVGNAFFEDSKKNWADYTAFVSKLTAEPAKAAAEIPKQELKAPPTKDVNLSAIEKQVEALHRAAIAELELAAATGKTEAEQRLALATSEANNLITKLYEEAAKQTGKAQQLLTAYVREHTEAIKADTAAKQVAKDAVKLSDELQKEGRGYSEQVLAIEKLIEAYKTGGSTLEAVSFNKQFQKDQEAIATLTAEYKLAVEQFGTGSNAAEILAKAIADANEQLEVNQAIFRELKTLEIDAVIEAQKKAFTDELPALENLAEAYLQGGEALREYNIQRQVSAFIKTHPEAGEAQIKAETEELRREEGAQHAVQIAREAASYSIIASYNTEIVKLGQIREALQQNKQDTILVDAAIYDANERLVRQWDAAALKIGDTREKFGAFLNEIKLQGQNLGEAVFGTLLKSFDDLENKLSEFVVSGKAKFSEVLTSLETGLTKSVLAKGFSSLAGGVEAKLGLGGIFGGKRGESPGQGLYVIPVDSSGKALSSLLGEGTAASAAAQKTGDSSGDISGLFSGIFSKIGGIFSSIFSSITNVLGGIAHGIGGFFSGFASIFGGFLESGGDVTPGKAYVVGEKRPELFVARQPGRVVPSLQGSVTRPITVENHFHGIVDFDSFKRNDAQVRAGIGGSIAAAQMRLR